MSLRPTTPKLTRFKRRACRFCADHDIHLDYKEPRLLGNYLSENAKILPRRLTGNCAYHQRRLTQAIKRARTLAYLPFTSVHDKRSS